MTDDIPDIDPADLWPWIPGIDVTLPAPMAHHLDQWGYCILAPPDHIAKLGYNPVSIIPIGDGVACPCGCQTVTIPCAIGDIA